MLGGYLLEVLGHDGLVTGHSGPIQPVVGKLQAHLQQGVRAELVPGDETLPKAIELQALQLVLVDLIR